MATATTPTPQPKAKPAAQPNPLAYRRAIAIWAQLVIEQANKAGTK